MTETQEHPDSKRIVWKVLRRVMPMILLMYVLAYLDRANIGFAQHAMEKDVGLTAAAFAFGAGIFFVGYAIAEIPSNMALAKVGAKLWLARIMVTWGVVAVGMMFVRNETMFTILRFLLGFMEGGLFPGVLLYITNWVPGTHRASAIGVFIFGAPLAFTFGSPVMTGLLALDGLAGLHGWQLMFLATGGATILVGFWSYFYLDNTPSQARFLSEVERNVLVDEMARDVTEREKISPRGLAEALVNPRLWFFALIYFALQIGIFALTFYLPSRIALITGQSVGVLNGLLTAIPWGTSILAIVVLTRFADRMQSKQFLAFVTLVLAGAGIAIGAVVTDPVLSLTAYVVAACGFMAVQPMFWTWPTGMLAGSAATGGLAMVAAIGALGGFVAPILKTWVDGMQVSPTASLITLGCCAMLGGIMLLFADRVRDTARIDKDLQLRDRSVAKS